MWIKLVCAPLLGALIGYITNDIAIKMLFRPYKAHYVGRFKLPFTPGLIPRRQERMAQSIGGVINDELLSAETVKKEALSEKALDTVRTTVNDWLNNAFNEERTARNLLEETVRVEDLPEKEEKVKAYLSNAIFDKVRDAKLGSVLAKLAIGEINVPLLANIIKNMEEPIANTIDGIIENKGKAFIDEEIEKLDKKLMDDSISSLISSHSDKSELLSDFAVKVYVRFIEDLLPQLFNKIGIDKIVANKIMEYDPKQLEALIFSIAKNELKAIVYLGALLGFIMGFINLLY